MCAARARSFFTSLFTFALFARLALHRCSLALAFLSLLAPFAHSLLLVLTRSLSHHLCPADRFDALLGELLASYLLLPLSRETLAVPKDAQRVYAARR